MREILLNHNHWEVKGFWPYVPFLGKSMELDQELMGVTDWIKATVPGGVHNDLVEAGLIEDPYYGINSLRCEWVENRWWEYRTFFELDPSDNEKSLEILFKGIDYKAHFYLNGKEIGVHEGMYKAFRVNITEHVSYATKNELVVLFEAPPSEMGQIGYTSMTKTQKSRFNYNWDFSTRLVNIGIWDDVILRIVDKVSIEDVFIKTDVQFHENTKDTKGLTSIEFQLNSLVNQKYKAIVNLSFDNQKLETFEKMLNCKKGYDTFTADIQIENPKLWFPNGIGEQPLYDVSIEIYDEDKLLEKKEYKTGYRKLQYKRNTNSAEDTLPYTFVINNISIYIKGVNITPFDLMYGNISRQTYEDYVFYMREANINLVRVWGGGVIEKEYFYQLCDQYGIMVWQEFIQSSSGIDNIPSTNPRFLELLQETAIQAVKLKRNHICHIVWSGGNELMDSKRIPVNYKNPNISMLKDIVESYDLDKLFLPTSASGPNEFLNTKELGRNHDVHGSWKYEGIQKHYSDYNQSDSLFHSEFGVDGLSHATSLQKFLNKNDLVVTNMKENLVWRHHGEWWDTYFRDMDLFGPIDTLDQFSKCSQLVQAEGLRYILESNRRRKYENSGSIIWQLNEPWPNVSCTSLIDYYKLPKMAYYFASQAFEPIHVSLAYNSLNILPRDELKGSVHINNSSVGGIFEITLELLTCEGEVLHDKEVKCHIESNTTKKLFDICQRIPETKEEIFFIRLRVLNQNGIICSENIYFFSQKEELILAPLLAITKAKLHITKVQKGYLVKNVGKQVALFVHGIDNNGERPSFIKDNYSSLFPDEEKLFIVRSASDNYSCHIKWESLI